MPVGERQVGSWRRIVLLIVAGIGAGHFLLGLLLCIRFLVAIPGAGRPLTVFSLPYLGLFAAFAWAFAGAARGRMRASTWILLIAVGCSAALCAYDLSHGERAQIMGGGVGHTYLYWWWYYEPYWHGYRPGNV